MLSLSLLFACSSLVVRLFEILRKRTTQVPYTCIRKCMKGRTLKTRIQKIIIQSSENNEMQLKKNTPSREKQIIEMDMT